MNDASPRIRLASAADARPDGEYVLYWMTAARRLGWNYALDRALAWARRTGKPLLIFEALRVGYPWASDRLHRFVLDGMAEHHAALAEARVGYYPYVEPREGAGRGLLAALAENAAVVVTDEYPTFFHPAMLAAATRQVRGRLEVVDSLGLLPLSAHGKAHATAYAFRRTLQKLAPAALGAPPARDPLDQAPGAAGAVVPKAILQRWPAASGAMLAGAELGALPIDHSVGPTDTRGGTLAARTAWRRFLTQRLERYGTDRSHPDDDASSGLSPWLHFGHLSVHEVFDDLADWCDWSPERVGTRAAGQREGYWNMGPAADAFLDELVTWRELGHGAATHDPAHASYAGLPTWARATLEKHSGDPREHLYDVAAFEGGETHDAVWNAAAHELRAEGRIHNYMRMLWGKKVLEWTRSPEEAFEVLVHLNNKYALDGRDPNSYAGIAWTLGRYDRPWAPERPVFGSVRWMSSANTLKKLRAKAYVRRHAAPGA